MTTLLVHSDTLLIVDVLAQRKTEQVYRYCQANSELWTLDHKKARFGHAEPKSPG
ncbi:hypothetical protein ACQ4M3_19435 [Leptolyngbya sp. AN03gr2]|uniref:hypothetical protein n=1 Tax=unclassified Leptolyngbya TaxID=2650499 RepID=UPI003D3182AF